MSEIKLKPCPFCGCEEIYLEEYDTVVGKRWRVFCTNCMAGIDTGCDQSWGKPVEAWNKRVSEKEDKP